MDIPCALTVSIKHIGCCDMIGIHEGTRTDCCVGERNFPTGTVAPRSGILREEGCEGEG